MSVTRKLKVDYDLDVMEDAARSLGYTVEHNSDCRMWYNSERVDMVIRCKPGMGKALDWGFVKSAEGTMEVRADFHGESNGPVAKMASDILPEYYKRKLGRHAEIDRVAVEKGKLKIFVKRR